MKTRLVLKAGEHGTKKLVKEYGEQLMFVRYRYDAIKKKRYKTVELIIEEVDWQPALRPEELVAIRVQYDEFELREKVKAAGARWNPRRQFWEMSYWQAVELGLERRMARERDGVYVVQAEDGDYYPLERVDEKTLGWVMGTQRWDVQF